MRMTHSFDHDTATRLSARAAEPAWLASRRAEAFERFASLPWPDAQSEAWRYTDMSAFDLDAFDPLPIAHEAVDSLDGLPDEVQQAIGAVGDRDGFAVQIDADVVLCHLNPALQERGVIFAPLARAAVQHEERVRAALGGAGVSDSEEKIYALNAAFGGGGAFLFVPRGVTLDLPVQSLRWISRDGIAVFPRVVIVAEEGASVTYIDHYASTSAGEKSLCAASVEIYAHKAAQVSYLAVQDWSQSVWHFNVQRARIDRDATVRSLAAAFGAGTSRSVVECLLDGEGAHSEMLGAYFGDHDQHIDHRSLQQHIAPNTTSDLYYKGALKGHSRAVYSGLVRIEKDARGADAQQTNRNLLLSEGAAADPKPFLEIETNDVRCTHGVSVGRPDPDVLFYLRSRGLDEAEAERLFVTGFFQEVLDRVGVPEVRVALERAVENELAMEE